MASTISEEMRKEFEEYIAEHEPYPDDAEEMMYFDGHMGDIDRKWATLMKKALEGKL